MHVLQSARRLQHEKDVVVSLSHESRALQSRLDTEQDAIKRMETVLALVERFPTEETAPGEGPTLQVYVTLIIHCRASIVKHFEFYSSNPILLITSSSSLFRSVPVCLRPCRLIIMKSTRQWDWGTWLSLLYTRYSKRNSPPGTLSRYSSTIIIAKENDDIFKWSCQHVCLIISGQLILSGRYWSMESNPRVPRHALQRSTFKHGSIPQVIFNKKERLRCAS